MWTAVVNWTSVVRRNQPVPRARNASQRVKNLIVNLNKMPMRSSPWSNSRLDLVQMLAPVVGAHGVERAGHIQARKKVIRKRGHELVGLFRNAHRQLGQGAWSNRVDQWTR